MYNNYVYLYYPNLFLLLLFCVMLLCSLKSFKKEKRKSNASFVSFFFLLMSVVFLNIHLFKTSFFFPTFYHFLKNFQGTSILQHTFSKKLSAKGQISYSQMHITIYMTELGINTWHSKEGPFSKDTQSPKLAYKTWTLSRAKIELWRLGVCS